MRTITLLALIAGMTLSGCIGLGEDEEIDPSVVDTPALEPQVLTWDGMVLLSPLGALAHTRETEPHVAPIQSEGFVLEITEVPGELVAELTWDPQPQARALIMVSSPRDEEDRGLEYFTEMNAEGRACLVVPPEDLVPGKWQVMAHTANAVDMPITFTLTLVGGAASILDEPHSSAEAGQTTEGETLPCEDA